MKSLRETFKDGSGYVIFFLSILIMGLANSAYAATIKTSGRKGAPLES